MKPTGQTLVLLACLWTFERAFGHPCFFWKDAQFFDGVCYQMSDTAVNWLDAKAACKSQHGQLVDPTTEKTESFLKYMLMVSAKEINWWIGRVLGGNQIVWTSHSDSTREPSLDGNQACQYISAFNNRIQIPSIMNDSCGETKRFICERYVGNPCTDAGMPDGEIYNGVCYYYHPDALSWDKSRERCNKRGALLAEFRQREPYDYMKGRLRELEEITVTTPPNELKYVRDYNITLLQEHNTITFYLLSCGSPKLYLYNVKDPIWSSTDCTSKTVDLLPKKNYIEISLWNSKDSRITMQKCSLSWCCRIGRIGHFDIPRPDCSRPILVQISGQFTVTVNTINDTFSVDERVTSETDMAVYTENSTGLWYFEKRESGPLVFLGAAKPRGVTEKGQFKWLSKNETVSIDDWNTREPNGPEETYLTWGVNRDINRTIGLNDYGGSTSSFCFKNALVLNYVLALPRRRTDNNNTLLVVVKSGSTQMTYLLYSQMSNRSHTLTQNLGWASVDHSASFNVSWDLQLRNGIATGFVVLNSTHDVIVTVRRGQDDADFPIVTFLNNISGRDYCISLNESCAIDYFTVTAIRGATNVTFVFRDESWITQLSDVESLTVKKNAASVSLGYMETLHIDGDGKTNTGIAAHASDDVAVYVWSNCTRSYVELLPPESKTAPLFRCLKTSLRCACGCNITRSLALAQQQAKSIRRQMIVPVAETGAHKRTKVSQPDARPSSHGLAGLGITILVLALTVISLADIVNIIVYVYSKLKVKTI